MGELFLTISLIIPTLVPHLMFLKDKMLSNLIFPLKLQEHSKKLLILKENPRNQFKLSLEPFIMELEVLTPMLYLEENSLNQIRKKLKKEKKEKEREKKKKERERRKIKKEKKEKERRKIKREKKKKEKEKRKIKKELLKKKREKERNINIDSI